MGQVKIGQDGAALCKDGENFLLTPYFNEIKVQYFKTKARSDSFYFGNFLFQADRDFPYISKTPC